MRNLQNTVINFHAIYDSAWMESVFLLLKKKYTIISLDELMAYYYNNKELKNTCHITFDDGNSTFYKIVYPLLKKYNIPVSIYVSPYITKHGGNFWFQEIKDYDQKIFRNIIAEAEKKPIFNKQILPITAILKSFPISKIHEYIRQYKEGTKTLDKPSLNMNTKQILDLHKSGLVAIGAHTQFHPILKNESNDKAETEIITSVLELGEILGKKVEHFAYPNGIPNMDFGYREMNYLKQARIKLAFSTELKPFDNDDNVLSIPRNGLSKGNQHFVLTKLQLGNKWDTIKRLLKGKQEKDYRKDILEYINITK